MPVEWLNAAESAARATREWACRLLIPAPGLPAETERLTLPDGTPAFIYPLPKSAGAALAAGLSELSAASRYQRFLSARERFTAAELDFLTDCDGINHMALVLAVRPAPGKALVPVAVARGIRDFTAPDLAEMAIAVADRWQGRGVGCALLGALQRRSWEAGTRRWRAFLFAENRPMWRLLDGVGVLESRRYEGPGCVEAIYALLPPALPARQDSVTSTVPPLAVWAGLPAAALLVTGGVRWWKKRRGPRQAPEPYPQTH